ncbi:MAG: DUF167 domain-containing protein [Patescibacteria group bacterium]
MKINVQARPGAREEKVEKIDGSNFRVWVKEPPVQGKANAAIIKALAEYFGVSQSQVRIVSGYASRAKIIEISN